MNLSITGIFTKLAQIGIEPEDTHEVRLQKNLLLFSALMMATAGIVWGALYISLDEKLAGAIPLAYSSLSYASIIHFARTRRYRVFRFSQLAFSLLLPFILMIALGGFVNGSAVIVWSFTSPIGALFSLGPRAATRWYLAFLGLVILSGVLEAIARPANNLPYWMKVAFFVLNFSVLSLIVFRLMLYFVAQKNLAMEMLDQERQKSDKLLLNVLPAEIVPVMKAGKTTFAERFDEVSILFADIVNSTPLAASMPAEEFVELLNRIFTIFDTLVAKYGVEKIRTIGDNYMVASGVPCPRQDHAHALLNLALEFLTCLQTIHPPVSFRIGVNSGSAVAGVIGQEKFHYDLYGDAVNIASRMESHGVAGKIQVTQATYELVKEEFLCEQQGMVEVKGKGGMPTWFVLGPKPA